jgi:hypothetical protein
MAWLCTVAHNYLPQFTGEYLGAMQVNSIRSLFVESMNMLRKLDKQPTANQSKPVQLRAAPTRSYPSTASSSTPSVGGPTQATHATQASSQER